MIGINRECDSVCAGSIFCGAVHNRFHAWSEWLGILYLTHEVFPFFAAIHGHHFERSDLYAQV